MMSTRGNKLIHVRARSQQHIGRSNEAATSTPGRNKLPDFSYVCQG